MLLIMKHKTQLPCRDLLDGVRTPILSKKVVKIRVLISKCKLDMHPMKNEFHNSTRRQL